VARGIDEVAHEPASVLARIVIRVTGVPVVSHLHLQFYWWQVDTVTTDLAQTADGLAEGEQTFIAPLVESTPVRPRKALPPSPSLSELRSGVVTEIERLHYDQMVVEQK
jgi:hypothetical protein